MSRMPVEAISFERRDFIVAAGAGAIALGSLTLVAPSTRADLPAMQASLAKIVGDRRVEEGRIRLNIPDIAENGATVPVTIEVDSPMTADDYVTAVHLLNERNPLPEVASFYLSQWSGQALISTRIRLATSQRVHAVAEMSDGSVFKVAREVKVTIGGCGG